VIRDRGPSRHEQRHPKVMTTRDPGVLHRNLRLALRTCARSAEGSNGGRRRSERRTCDRRLLAGEGRLHGRGVCSPVDTSTDRWPRVASPVQSFLIASARVGTKELPVIRLAALKTTCTVRLSRRGRCATESEYQTSTWSRSPSRSTAAGMAVPRRRLEISHDLALGGAAHTGPEKLLQRPVVPHGRRQAPGHRKSGSLRQVVQERQAGGVVLERVVAVRRLIEEEAAAAASP
jgi:hypothetical protein